MYSFVYWPVHITINFCEKDLKTLHLSFTPFSIPTILQHWKNNRFIWTYYSSIPILIVIKPISHSLRYNSSSDTLKRTLNINGWGGFYVLTSMQVPFLLEHEFHSFSLLCIYFLSPEKERMIVSSCRCMQDWNP